jgi:hypothetical protein
MKRRNRLFFLMSATSESKNGVFSDWMGNNKKEVVKLARVESRVLLHDFFPSINQV